MADVTEMPAPEVAETENIPPETAPQPPTSAPREKGKPGRPPKGSQRPPEARQPAFFDRVANIPKEDWGTRAYMYVYADEPVCNPKTFGATRYLLKSSAPILDLEGLKQDYGSFKGWMSLNTRKTGKDQTDEMDRLDFEIYDPKNPPKIPRSAWANDPRNKRWLDLMPPEKPSPSEGAATMLDAMKVYKEIRNDVKDEIGPEPQATDQTKSTLETMKLAKELFAPPVTAPVTPPADPFTIAAKVMEMRANDPMVGMLMQRLDSMDKALAESRTREFQLQKEMLEKAAAPKAEAKSFFDQLMEFAADDNKLDRIKKVAGVFGFGDGGGGRSGRFTGLELAREIVNSPFGAQLGGGIGTLLTNLAAGGQSTNGAMPPNALNPVPPNGAGAAPGVTHESDQARIARIASAITNPMMNEYFDLDMSGEDFASWFYDGFPEDFLFMRKLGADKVVDLYRQFNVGMWQHITNHPKLGNREQKFRTFMHDAYAWKTPDEEEGETAPANGVRDLSEEEN